MATLGSFIFSFFLNLASSTSTSASHDDCIETQRQQRQGQCHHASGQTTRQERVGEGATRAVGARRGSRRHCWQQVDNVTRASNEQRAAGGCSNDGGGNVVARTAGGGQCDKTRRIRRTMRQHQMETADNGTRAGGDKDSKRQDRNKSRRRMTGDGQ